MHVSTSQKGSLLFLIQRQWLPMIRSLHISWTEYKEAKNTPVKKPSTKQKKASSGTRSALNVDTSAAFEKESIKKSIKTKSLASDAVVDAAYDKRLILPAGLLGNFTPQRRDTKEKKTEIAPNASHEIKPELRKRLHDASSSDSNAANISEEKTFEVFATPPIYIEKDNVITPFPMIIDKVILQSNNPSEIISIAGTGLNHRQVPSVTQILNETMPESSAIALAIWRKRKLAEIGEEGFREYMREAKTIGKELHLSIETCLRGVDYNQVGIEPRISGHWLSLKSILNSVRSDVRALETYVFHPRLKYKGFVDCIASHNGTLVLIDWKTSQRRKNTLEDTYDDPVQIAAYIGAINADENYPFMVESALLVVAYPTGFPADVLYLNRDQCETYWQIWLKRLEEFDRLKSSENKAPKTKPPSLT